MTHSIKSLCRSKRIPHAKLPQIPHAKLPSSKTFLLPQSDLQEHMKLNNATESQIEGNVCCVYHKIYISYCK